jgi:hypothetical protein
MGYLLSLELWHELITVLYRNSEITLYYPFGHYYFAFEELSIDSGDNFSAVWSIVNWNNTVELILIRNRICEKYSNFSDGPLVRQYVAWSNRFHFYAWIELNGILVRLRPTHIIIWELEIIARALSQVERNRAFLILIEYHNWARIVPSLSSLLDETANYECVR